MFRQEFFFGSRSDWPLALLTLEFITPIPKRLGALRVRFEARGLTLWLRGLFSKLATCGVGYFIQVFCSWSKWWFLSSPVHRGRFIFDFSSFSDLVHCVFNFKGLGRLVGHGNFLVARIKYLFLSHSFWGQSVRILACFAALLLFCGTPVTWIFSVGSHWLAPPHLLPVIGPFIVRETNHAISR